MKYTPSGGGINQLTGDGTAGPGTGSQALTLATVTTAETVGDATHYPVVTTDAKGRVTGMVATAVPSSGVDLLQFFQSTLPANQVWTAVTYGNGVFVAVGGSATAAYSADGIHWTASTLPNQSWSSVAYGNGTFVAVGGTTGNTGAYSRDGITWQASTLPNQSWSSVAYGNGTFVAVAQWDQYTNPTAAAAYSSDGITWGASTLPSAQYWTAVTYGNGAFVALSGYGTSTVGAYSADGITWHASTLPNQSWSSVAYGNGAFVAISTGGGAISTNGGVTWSAVTLPAPGSYETVVYGNGAFVAISASVGEAVAAYSTDNGATWGTVLLPVASVGYAWPLTFGGGNFVVVGSGTAAMYSRAVTLASNGVPQVSTPAVTSGTAFAPSLISNATIYFQINAAVAGSYTLTMGPSTGAEYTIGSAVAMLVGSDDLVTLVVPRGWLVVLTLTSVTLGSTTVVAM